MVAKSAHESKWSRRTLLKRGTTAGIVGVAGLLSAVDASAQQGGVAYLKEKQLRGNTHPNEPRFRIVEPCGTTTVDLPCDGVGERTYAAYKIRCPNYPDGDDHTGVDEDECTGGSGCGRHILVNRERDLRPGGLYEFVSVRDCGDGYVRASFRPA